jgi:hypothetical protein
MGRLVAGLAVVGLLIAAGCGDDDGGGASSEEIERFCAGFNEINDRFSDINPVADPGALDEALEMLRDLEPPEEIADEFTAVLNGFEALSEINITDPEAVRQVQEDLPEAEEAFDAVDQFVEAEC